MRFTNVCRRPRDAAPTRTAWFLALALSAVSVGCDRSGDVLTIDLLAFHTTVSFSVFEPPAHFADATMPLVEHRIRELETAWRSFGPGNLGVLNDILERGGCADVDPHTSELIQRALALAASSNGLFDPTLGIELHALGFRDPTLTPGPPLGVRKGTISTEGRRVCSDGPVRLDLGGIAKGAIVVELGALLRAHQINNALINVGGDVLVLGSRGGTPWRVAIQHPRRAGVIARINANDGDAIFSSGDYYRRRQSDNGSVHHILDPRSGQSALTAVATTVIHRDPLVADAAATALFVAGPEDFERTAQAMGVARALLIDAELEVHQLDGTALDVSPLK